MIQQRGETSGEIEREPLQEGRPVQGRGYGVWPTGKSVAMVRSLHRLPQEQEGRLPVWT